MTPRLDDKVALVAGGARGAGRGIAVELGAALLPVLAVRDGVGDCAPPQRPPAPRVAVAPVGEQAFFAPVRTHALVARATHRLRVSRRSNLRAGGIRAARDPGASWELAVAHRSGEHSPVIEAFLVVVEEAKNLSP
jgi:NAD(P)-dependent dehydrogenase (short-subunit alcohol dehydrogenase family)